MKKFPEALKSSSSFLGFKYDVLKKDSKQAIIDVVAISRNSLFSDYRYTIPFQRYTIRNNGKKGVTFEGTYTSVYSRPAWYKEEKNKVTFNFKLIFKESRAEYVAPSPSSKALKRLNSNYTMGGLEKRFTEHDLMKYVNEDMSGMGVFQVKPSVVFKKISSSNVVELSAGTDGNGLTGYAIPAKDLKLYEEGPFKTGVKKVQGKNYVTYIASQPYYAEYIFVKSKNGKYYYTCDIKLIEYNKKNYNPYNQKVRATTIKKHQKDISLLRSEVIMILTSLEKNPKLYIKQ